MTQATTNPDHTPASQSHRDVQYNPLEHGNECFRRLLPLDMTSPKDTRLDERIITLHRLRTFIESQPRTRSLFKLGDVRDATGCQTRGINKEMLNFIGAWEVPERFPGGSRQNYVNPRSTDAWMYSPVGTFCECGALVYSAENGEQKAEGLPVGQTTHTDECHIAMRTRAQAEAVERRHEEVQIALKYNNPPCRVGSKARGVARVARFHGFLKTETNEMYKERLAHTAAAWLHQYPLTAIAASFGGLTAKTLGKYVDEYTIVDTHEMYIYRQPEEGSNQLAMDPYPFPDSSTHPPRRWFDNPHEVEFDD